MKKYKLIFESGVTETIEVGSLEMNRHIGKIEVKNKNGEDIEIFYLDFDQLAAIIPQELS